MHIKLFSDSKCVKQCMVEYFAQKTEQHLNISVYQQELLCIMCKNWMMVYKHSNDSLQAFVCFSFVSGSSTDTGDSLITGYQVNETPLGTAFK
jgi:hypothetical protein